MSSCGPTVRPALARDAAQCAEIYTAAVLDSVATFEVDPVGEDDMRERIAAAHVWFVVEDGGDVVGFAYGGPHRARAAYRWSADVSVYLAAGHRGRGHGRRLYEALLARLRERGVRTVCAGITQPNPASEALHRSLGFTDVGVYRRIGYKHGAWRDVRWMQLDLRPGEDGPPPDA